MKQLVIEMPAEAVGHVINGLAGINGYLDKISDPTTGEQVDNPISKEDFAMGVLKDWMLSQALAFNVADQKRQAAEKIEQVAVKTAEALAGLVSLKIEDAA